MLDMGFQPQVDKLVRRLPRNRQRCSSRRRSTAPSAARPRVHEQPLALRRVATAARAGGHRALLRVGHLRHEAGDARPPPRGSRTGSRSSSSCKARRRPAREEARAPAGGRGRDARRHVPASPRALARAVRGGKVRTLVATDVAARGLDLDDITHVINYDPRPSTRATCTARAAPAARDSGNAITFVLPTSRPTHERRPPARARREVRGSRPALCRPARVLRAPPPELEVVDG